MNGRPTGPTHPDADDYPLGVTVTHSNPVIGAEVAGVDLRVPLPPRLRDELYSQLLQHRVLFFRDQHLSTQQHIAFAEAFGPILIFRSVVPAAPQHPGIHDVDGSTVGWHIDASGRPEPPAAAVLRAVEIPPAGGDTIWANGVAAYQGLSDELKNQLEDKYVTHSAPDGEHPVVAHPMVRTHPDTEERHLYINLAPWTDPLVLGMSRSDSDALIDEVRREYLQPEYQVRFRWSPGAIAMWDNRVVQHTGTADYGEHRRHIKRICIAHFHRNQKPSVTEQIPFAATNKSSTDVNSQLLHLPFSH